MSKQARTPTPSKPPHKSGPSYAELKAENVTLQAALARAFAELQQYQQVAETLQTALNAVGVLGTRIAYIVTETMASGLPDALGNHLTQQAVQRQASAPAPGVTLSGDNGATVRRRGVAGEPGLAEAPVFTGVPRDGGSNVSITGEVPDDFDDDDDDRI